MTQGRAKRENQNETPNSSLLQEPIARAVDRQILHQLSDVQKQLKELKDLSNPNLVPKNSSILSVPDKSTEDNGGTNTFVVNPPASATAVGDEIVEELSYIQKHVDSLQKLKNPLAEKRSFQEAGSAGSSEKWAALEDKLARLEDRVRNMHGPQNPFDKPRIELERQIPGMPLEETGQNWQHRNKLDKVINDKLGNLQKPEDRLNTPAKPDGYENLNRKLAELKQQLSDLKKSTATTTTAATTLSTTVSTTVPTTSTSTSTTTATTTATKATTTAATTPATTATIIQSTTIITTPAAATTPTSTAAATTTTSAFKRGILDENYADQTVKQHLGDLLAKDKKKLRRTGTRDR